MSQEGKHNVLFQLVYCRLEIVAGLYNSVMVTGVSLGGGLGGPQALQIFG